jgi:alpha-N-acetylglucosaminidase
MKKNSITVLFLAFVFGAIGQVWSNPVDDFLNRIGGNGASSRFVTELKPSSAGQDYFTLTSENGKPKIVGNSYLSVTTGIGWYLKYHLNIHLSWNNLTTDLTSVKLPLPEKAETRFTTAKYRYYFNYCTFSYSMAFWDWERWQKEIDWMALRGINMPLALTGTEVVWYNILRNGLGYTKEEADAFVAGSAYQAWFLMNNLEGWGGPNPDSWYERQTNLQRRILARMHEFGMKPVLAGYSGMVPHNIGEKKGWNITSSGKWCNFVRPEFIRTSEPQFYEMAKLYYDEMRRLYGTANYYSIDLFHEGSTPDGVNVGKAHLDVYNAMKKYSGATDPKWVLQAWGHNPQQAALDSLPPGKLIVLDLWSDMAGRWQNSYKQTNGTPHEFVFCLLHNFGGRTGLFGGLAKTISEFYDAKTKFPNTKIGVGATMEAVENNPVVYELLFELPWIAGEFSASEWVEGYAKMRYGVSNEAAKQAWLLLNRSIYNCTQRQEGTTESVLCARPALEVNRVSCCSSTKMYWDPQDVRKAASLLLSQHSSLSGVNFQYDVVDIVRQTLADYGNELLKRIKSAHDDKNTALRNARIDTFLNVILDMDRLLNTIPEFMVGNWIASARKMGNTDAEKKSVRKKCSHANHHLGRQRASQSRRCIARLFLSRMGRIDARCLLSALESFLRQH